MATNLRLPLKTAFPEARVEECLREALAVQAEEQAVLRRDGSAHTQSGSSWEPEIDSLVVVELICAVEELLWLTFPATFAPKGGYVSVEACIEDLVEKARAAWDKFHAGGL